MIHIVSKEYYLKNKTKGKMKKIIVERSTFQFRHNFFMKDGICFIYMFELGFLIVPEDSGFTEDILKEDVSKWYVEKYEKTANLTKNYKNAYPTISIYLTERNEWVFDYDGYLRVWNNYTSESFIFLKLTEDDKFLSNCSNPKSYICRLVTGDKVSFPIDFNKALEFNMLIKIILEWT